MFTNDGLPTGTDAAAKNIALTTLINDMFDGASTGLIGGLTNPQTVFIASEVTQLDPFLRAYIAKYKDNLTEDIKLYPLYIPGVGLLARFDSSLTSTEWGQIETINNYRLSDDPSLWTNLFSNNVVPLQTDPDVVAKYTALTALGLDMLE